MKELYDGTAVSKDTPTKLVNGKRYLLTEEEQKEVKRRDSDFKKDKPKREARLKIKELRSQITTEKLIDAILGNDNGWLANQADLIKIEKNKLGE